MSFAISIFEFKANLLAFMKAQEGFDPDAMSGAEVVQLWTAHTAGTGFGEICRSIVDGDVYDRYLSKGPIRLYKEALREALVSLEMEGLEIKDEWKELIR